MGTVTVVQKAWNDRAPEAVLVNPTFVLGLRGTVFAKRLHAQKGVIFLLAVKAPVPSAIG